MTPAAAQKAPFTAYAVALAPALLVEEAAGVVTVLAAVVVPAVEEDSALPATAVAAGTSDSAAAVLYAAETPVAFVQTVGGVTTPETKLTGAHLSIRQYI